MDLPARKDHWEHVYQTKQADQVSWYQPLPQPSLRWIEEACPDKKAAIIDIGCGDAFLSEALLKKGYENLTALDLSTHAIRRAKERLGTMADKIAWVASDVLSFLPEKPFTVWHDRAAFHFLTAPADISLYASVAAKAIMPGGILIIGAFSENGPHQCSGLPVHPYNAESLSLVFRMDFDAAETQFQKHVTPAGKEQDLIFIRFRKRY